MSLDFGEPSSLGTSLAVNIAIDKQTVEWASKAIGDTGGDEAELRDLMKELDGTGEPSGSRRFPRPFPPDDEWSSWPPSAAHEIIRQLIDQDRQLVRRNGKSDAFASGRASSSPPRGAMSEGSRE